MSIRCFILRKESHLSKNRYHLLKVKIFIRDYSLCCFLLIILVFPLQLLTQYNFFLNHAKFPLKSLFNILLTLFIVIWFRVWSIADFIKLFLCLLQILSSFNSVFIKYLFKVFPLLCASTTLQDLRGLSTELFHLHMPLHFFLV